MILFSISLKSPPQDEIEYNSQFYFDLEITTNNKDPFGRIWISLNYSCIYAPKIISITNISGNYGYVSYSSAEQWIMNNTSDNL